MSTSGPPAGGAVDDKALGIDESGKLRRGYRHCISCKAVVGVATRTCPHCETVLFERQTNTKFSKAAKRKSGPEEEDAGPAVHSAASVGGTASDTAAAIPIATSHSRPQEGEKLDLAPFEREDPDDNRVMAEVPAGSNVYYQAWLVAESLTEMKLRFPATRRQEERIEWVDKRSSRLSRQGLSARLWKFLKGSDGAWVPRGSDPVGALPGQRSRKRPAGSTGATPAASSDQGHAGTHSGGALRGARSDEEESGGGSERGKAAGDDPLAAWFKRQREVLQSTGMVLLGCAESGGEAVLKRSRGRPPKKRQGGAVAHTEAASSSSADSRAGGGSTDGVAVLSGRGSHAVRDTAGAPPHTVRTAQISKLPSRQLSVLEEDDLFSGGPGRKAQVAPGGSPQLPPITLPGPPLPQQSAGTTLAKQPGDNVLKPPAAAWQPRPPAPVATVASHLFKRRLLSASDAVAESGGSTRMPDRDVGDHAAVEGPMAAAAEMIPGVGPSRGTSR